MNRRKQLVQNPEFRQFLSLVEQKLADLTPLTADLKAELLSERAELERSCQGWRRSLGDPDLDDCTRRVLQGDVGAAQRRINEIEGLVQQLDSSDGFREQIVDPEVVAQRLAHLDEVLMGDAASITNLELAQHIEAIHCYADGRVIIRTCQLGALADPADFCSVLEMCGDTGSSDESDEDAVRQRRRTRRRVVADIDDDERIEAANDFAVNPRRFAGLGPEWFTEDTFQVPRRLSWSEEHALEVAQFRMETGATMAKTAERFDRTIPTIRAALRYARDLHGIDALGKSVSTSTRAFWPRDHAAEVAEFFRQPGVSMKDAQEHFGKSQPWISKARKIAQERGLDVETPGSCSPARPTSEVIPDVQADPGEAVA
ncbi:MAG: transposase [Planctomycetaceae bacterium]|nr:transposase [Planctomycetaceae bacterium]